MHTTGRHRPRRRVLEPEGSGLTGRRIWSLLDAHCVNPPCTMNTLRKPSRESSFATVLPGPEPFLSSSSTCVPLLMRFSAWISSAVTCAHPPPRPPPRRPAQHRAAVDARAHRFEGVRETKEDEENKAHLCLDTLNVPQLAAQAALDLGDLELDEAAARAGGHVRHANGGLLSRGADVDDRGVGVARHDVHRARRRRVTCAGPPLST